MKKIALLEKEDRIVLFTQSAAKMKLHPTLLCLYCSLYIICGNTKSHAWKHERFCTILHAK